MRSVFLLIGLAFWQVGCMQAGKQPDCLWTELRQGPAVGPASARSEVAGSIQRASHPLQDDGFADLIHAVAGSGDRYAICVTGSVGHGYSGDPASSGQASAEPGQGKTEPVLSDDHGRASGGFLCVTIVAWSDHQIRVATNGMSPWQNYSPKERQFAPFLSEIDVASPHWWSVWLSLCDLNAVQNKQVAPMLDALFADTAMPSGGGISLDSYQYAWLVVRNARRRQEVLLINPRLLDLHAGDYSTQDPSTPARIKLLAMSELLRAALTIQSRDDLFAQPGIRSNRGTE